MTKYYYHDLTVRQACKEKNISESMVMHRIHSGWDVISAVETPRQRNFRGARWKHTCPKCKFLEHYEGHDLYVCKGKHGPEPGTWLIARFGNGELHYSACRKGMAYNHVLRVAEGLC